MLDPNSPEVWLGYADESYLAARLLWFTGLQIGASVQAHRTLELYLKAYLVSAGEEVTPGSNSWGHALDKLRKVCGSHCSDFFDEPVARRLKFFDRYFEFVRYPSEPGSPEDDSLTWFGFDSNVAPMDELVAFIRPRIILPDSSWSISQLNQLKSSSSPEREFQTRALSDCNTHLDQILCDVTNRSSVSFDHTFNYDKPGC